MSLTTTLQPINVIQTTLEVSTSGLVEQTVLGVLQTSVVVTSSPIILTTINTGIVGPPGPSGGGLHAPINFSFGDASPQVVLTLTEAEEIARISLDVKSAFDGTNPQVQLGIAGTPGLLLDTWQSDLTQESGFESYPRERLPAGSQVILTLSFGSAPSQGQGQILITSTPSP